MESEYDKKFTEMKKYIPFLENMIKKLEMSGTGTENPRHAQLSKIKALRDLLQERSKRMKMENLKKCEQVLINLYAKVEQRDTSPGIQKAHERRTSSDRDASKLESVRNKLKKVSMESETRCRDTLPEIDRANGADLDCNPGSKEPALFQRRPIKYPTPEKYPSKSYEEYPRGPRSRTRVLISPERSSSHWSNKSEKDLYRRRSPPRSSRSPRCRSPRRRSPHYKKDKKKKKDHEKSGKKSSESVNIMLNVPEDTMDSLNTSDICERIMNCEDDDVDIDTLRDLKKQIMKELKHTKVKDSIFKKLLKKGTANEKVTEAEEGEISDSESEAIERIYGSLVLVNNETDRLDSSRSSGSKQSRDRKVQICLKFVPKSEIKGDKHKNENVDNVNDLDGNSYSKLSSQIQLPDPDVELVIDEPILEEPKLDKNTKPNDDANKNDLPTTPVKSNTDESNTPKNIEKLEPNDDKTSITSETPKCTKANNNTSFLEDLSPPVNKVPKHIPVCQPDLMPTGANFYKQIVTEDDSDPKPEKQKELKTIPTKDKDSPDKKDKQTELKTSPTKNEDSPDKPDKQTELKTLPTKNIDSPKPYQNPSNTDKQYVKPNSEKSYDKNSVAPKQHSMESQIESSQSQIPFLSEAEMPIANKTPKNDSVTEIDILQALKNEILNEKISIPGEDSEPPALHQPKIVTKVTDAKEISSKKKISLEKYKAQSSQVKPRIYKYKPNLPVSRGLTVKECERFNFPVELALSDESPAEDEEEESNKPDVYDDLIPRSPDHDDTDNTIMTNSPRIIPAEPLNKDKTSIAPTDIDMRTLSPKKSEPVTTVRSDVEITRPTDPRLRKDVSLNPNSTPRQIPFPNMTPSRTPSMSIEMTPSHVGFDVESTTSRKHVYAPSMSYNEPIDSNDRNYNSEWDDDRRQSQSTSRESYRSDRKDDYYSRAECPRTPSHYFGRGDNADGSSTPAHSYSRSDYNNTKSHTYARNEGSATPRHGYNREMPTTPIHPFGRTEKPSTPIHPFGRSEMPTTPIHPFGRNEKPSTPIHPFGRSEVSSSSSHSYGRHDAPRTPIHSFGRSDAPSTPIHPFGRSDAPSTPIHPFGRSDAPSTPIHPFGRSDAPSTPIHPFGRSDGSSTPAHSFGRSDGSSTPIHSFGRTNVTSTPAHSFGRNDTPTTPIHSFGRSEAPKTPVHPYGRDASDSYSRNDPRSTSQRSEDYNRSYDSRSDYKSHYSRNAQRHDDGRSYSSDIIYRNREKSVDRNRAYPSDRYSSQSALQTSERDYSRGMSSSRGESDRYARERSVGRISDSYSHLSRSSQYAETDPRSATSNEKYDKYNYERSHTRGQSVGRSYPFSTSSDNSMQYREKSVGKQYEEQNKDRLNQTTSSYYPEQSSRTHENRAFVRARSVGRMFEKDSNTVSVQAHAGRSFTIDTSVNSTFQLNLPSEGIVFDKLFDARRQRAASVGRSLHDKSVSRSTEHKSIFQTQSICRSNIADSNVYPISSISTSNRINSDRFSRAKSVGREILSSNKSLKDIKAEFESFRTTNLQALEQKSSYRKSATENKDYGFSSRNKEVAPDSYIIDRKSRWDSYEKQKVSKIDKDAYSPRKNPRDPRFNRHQGHTSNKRFNYVPPHERHRSANKNYGIVYTDHNISQGKILGPGSGVKNYRIPKIKRPEPEIQQTEEKETVEEPKDKMDDKSDDMTLLDRIDELLSSPVKNLVSNSKDENNEVKNSPKRSPQKMKINSSKGGSPMVTRSRRSNVVYDSDSGEEDVKEPTGSESSKQDKIKSQDEVKSAEKQKPNLDSLMFDDLDDDDTFSEKTSDDVLSNINALIAGLDQEMSTKKYDFSSLEDNSTAVKDKVDSETVSAPVTANTTDKENNQISNPTDLTPKEITDNTTNKIQSESARQTDKAKEVSDAEFHKGPENSAEETIAQLPGAHTQSNEFDIDKQTSEQTDIVSTSDAGDESTTTTKENALLIPTSCSSPDSTINTEDFDAKTKSTETANTEPNAQIEVGADITSTNTVVESVAPTQEDQVNKTGLSSILNTIKDLLSKLDDPSEHEKIKLKLETLTKMVSSAEPCTTDTKESNDSTAPNKPEAEKGELDVKEDGKEEAVSIKDKIEDSKLLSPQHDTNEIDTDIENEPSKNKEKKEEEKTSSVVASPISVEKTCSDTNVEPWNDAQETAPDQLNESFSNDDEPLVRKATRKIQQGKGKGKRGRRKRAVGPKANKPSKERVIRSADNVTKTKKKLSRELQQLQDDLRENMFNKQDVISTTGIRMCRLAKLDESVSKESSESPKQKETKKVMDVPLADDTPLGAKPLVVLEKIPAETEIVKPLRKKPGPKPKPKPLPSEQHKPGPGPKSMTKPRPGTPKFFEKDPFLFEYDSVSEATTNANDSSDNSESEAETLASSVSFTSNTELEKPKPKRKKRTWRQGIIKTKKNKKKVNKKQNIETTKMDQTISNIPDIGAFTDKNCCFSKDVFTYSCKLCMFEGTDIVKHYKICHPHYEIPMSRMSPNIAIQSIHQSIATDFQAMKQITVNKYICRFCFQTISGVKNSLENFFWHVVSTHTGEFKHFCSECRDETPCTFMLDTPPPPKGTNNLLMGYICEKCNFTQVSLENLKSHVSIRHNDEETEVYAISLGVLSPHLIKTAASPPPTKEKTRTLRSRRSKQNYDENSEDTTDNDEALKTKVNKQTTDFNPSQSFKSRIVFEKDIQDDSDIKDDGLEQDNDKQQEKSLVPNVTKPGDKLHDKEPETNEILYLHSHFKSSSTKAGIKEYVCCINGNDNHYKTSLLISMKKHVQTKHQESWDGYCHFCKVIVMPQGKHHFKDCLAHYLQNHMDNIPEIEPEIIQTPVEKEKPVTPAKPIINVRPLAELLSSPSVSTNEEIFPKIESIVSLNTESASNEVEIQAEKKQIKIADENILFEETQKEIISKKHRVALDTMMSKEKLSHIFKCAGRFCSFSCNSPEDALLHASTHSKREDSSAMKCAYCSVNTSGNAIDLVSHVFKTHGCCQFSCGKCFYRASAVQLVESHYARAHGVVTSGAVIKASTVTPSQDTVQSLSRIDAVIFYECSQEINDTKCKFKTYTQSKFVEHHEQKHPGAQPRCQICDFVASDLPNLIVHLAIHGLSLYQCTWCIYGGENETDILSHLSSRHPSRRPQAYLRQIMEAKDGTLKQLPMVYVSNKSSVAPIEITQPKINENPVKEAERSADLETLIGQTMQITENTNDSQDDHPEETIEDIVESSIVTAAPTPTTPTNVSAVEEQTTPVLQTVKSEPAPIPISLDSSEIVCLDTDDEDTNVTSLDHSDDSNMATQLSSPYKDQLASLYRCGNCLQTLKSVYTYRHHINTVHVSEVIKCFYCNFMTQNRKNVLKHYTEMHGPKKKKIYECATCQVLEDTLKNIKKHCLQAHGYKSVSENTESNVDGVERILVSQVTPRAAPKRKKSLPETAPTPAKVRRYSPEEVDLLPMKHILDDPVQCSICEFTSKIRLNIIRHLKAHEQQQPVPQIAPVNPVPHLETNEMHFDKMVNLASSSIQPSKPSQKQDNVTKVLDFLPPNLASRYPKYIPERQRYACGAKQCSYISIDEAMLKCHWEALHSGSNDFRCVHCPPTQELDKSQPLTAVRIIAHLKMHDMRLFACSLCPYYHHQQYMVEKHITEKHNSNAEVKIVRNSTNTPQSTAPALAQNAAPTMDLKPWQCGLCDFKSMLRQEVVEHCSRIHSSKFQYKCAFCPMRSSTLENVTKHQAGHAGMSGDIFYFYYREGFLPEDPNMPRWKKQRIMMKLPAEPEVKAETVEATTQPQTPITIDLNLVKKEVEDTTDKEMADGGLCKKYGEYCDPIGLKYLCPLCKVTTEEMRQTMQAHLYEELQYRKWSCAVCSYKSYHKKALQEHTYQEHRQNKEPVELPADVKLEEWIDNLLNHQDKKIKENLDKIQASKNTTLTRQDTASPSRSSPNSSTTSVTSTPTKVNQAQAPKESSLPKNLKELEAAFGSFGSANNSMFCCPKCDFKAQEESKMYQHLESELAKIRWCCTHCPMNFHVYHMAQLHCKSVHPGQNSRAVGAIKDPKTREEWIQTVIQHQKQNMSVLLNDNEEAPENSLLMVRYEKDVPIPDITNTQASTSSETSSRRNRRSSAQSTGDRESDDERLVIDENDSSSDEFEEPKKKGDKKLKCQYCDFETIYKNCLSDHTLRHYNLKPYKCHYCNFSSYSKLVEKHCVNMHPERAVVVDKVLIPDTPPTNLNLPQFKRGKKKSEPVAPVPAKKLPDLICLICGCNIETDQANFHTHANYEKQIVEINNVVVKCGICDAMRKTIIDIKSHYNSEHADLEINYAYHKLNSVTTNVTCLVEDCEKVCRLRDIEAHHNKTHAGKPLKYTLRSVGAVLKKPEAAASGVKRSSEEAEIPQKRLAKKSTTKLPYQEPRLMFDLDSNQASDSPTYTQEDTFGC